MAGLNKVQLIGYLGRDPEIRYTESKQPVATLNLATTRKYRNRAEQLVEDTEWHRVVVWGRMAETCNEYLKKGSMLFIDGRLQTRKWQDKDGADRWSTEVVAEGIQFLDRKPGGDGRPHPADRGDDPASQGRTVRGPDGGRERRDDGPPDLGPPPGDEHIPGFDDGPGGNNDISF